MYLLSKYGSKIKALIICAVSVTTQLTGTFVFAYATSKFSNARALIMFYLTVVNGDPHTLLVHPICLIQAGICEASCMYQHHSITLKKQNWGFAI